jgi:hypothetical protein
LRSGAGFFRLPQRLGLLGGLFRLGRRLCMGISRRSKGSLCRIDCLPETLFS